MQMKFAYEYGEIIVIEAILDRRKDEQPLIIILEHFYISCLK